MRSPCVLLFLVCLALASPASARLVAGAGSLQLSAIELMPKKRVLLADLGLVKPLDYGGGDGIVTGPLRTLGWISLGLGAAGVGAGGYLLRNDSDDMAGLALVGGGTVLAILGLGIIWATGTVSCATCGIVDNSPNEPPPSRDVFAGLDKKRKPDGVRKLTVLSLKF